MEKLTKTHLKACEKSLLKPPADLVSSRGQEGGLSMFNEGDIISITIRSCWRRPGVLYWCVKNEVLEG